VLSVLLWFTDSGYPFGIFWSLCCPSLIYRFWLPLWYLLVIVLSVLLWFTDSEYLFGIFWSLWCLSFFDLQILVTPLVSFGHCVVCPSLIDRFWLPLWNLVVIVLSVLLWFTDSGYLFGIFWPLCCLSFIYLQILVTPLVSFGHCVVCPSLIYRFWLPLWYLLVIVLSVLLYRFWLPLWYLVAIVLSPSLIYRFWFPLWYLLVIVLSVLLWFTDSGYPFGIFWSLCCLSFFDLQILVTPLVSFGHCVFCPSLIDRFWLSLWYLVVIVLSVFWFTDSGYPFGICWPLCCLSFFDLQILVTPLVSFGHCVVCPLQILVTPLVSCSHVVVYPSDSGYPYGIFWSLCCLSFFADSDYPFGILWPLCCLSFFDSGYPFSFFFTVQMSYIYIYVLQWADGLRKYICNYLPFEFWLKENIVIRNISFWNSSFYNGQVTNCK
jgi:hypothetical protein